MLLRSTLPPLLLLAAARPAGAPAVEPGPLSALCAKRQAVLPAQRSKEAVVASWTQHAGEDFDPYDRLTRPSTAAKQWELFHVPGGAQDWSGVSVAADVVHLGLFVNKIWDIDQREGSFQLQAYLEMRWQDDRMCFNGTRLPPRESVRPCAAGHPNCAKVGAMVELDEMSMLNQTTGVSILQSIWLPDVHFVNSIRSGDEEIPDASLLTVTESGLVRWRQRFIVGLSADFNFVHLPFDKQILSVVLESYRMPTTAMQLAWIQDADKTGGRSDSKTGIALEGTRFNPEWKFRPMDDSCEDDQQCAVWYRSCVEGEDAISPAYQVARFDMGVEREHKVWHDAYILPSFLLLFISWMGLFIANHNPGRPTVHTVTVLTHLTIDTSIRAQLPSIATDTWITTFQSTMMFFHVLIFINFCVVHYAYRQKQKLKKKRVLEKQTFLDSLKLSLQLHRMAETDRRAVEALLQAVPNSWHEAGLTEAAEGGGLGSEREKDKRIAKVQRNLGLSDEALEAVVRGAAPVLGSPTLSAIELVQLAYGGAVGEPMASLEKAAEDADDDGDRLGLSRRRILPTTSSSSSSFSTELLQPGEPSTGSAEFMEGPQEPRYSQKVEAFARAVCCCSSKHIRIVTNWRASIRFSRWLATLTKLDWTSRVLIPLLFFAWELLWEGNSPLWLQPLSLNSRSWSATEMVAGHCPAT